MTEHSRNANPIAKASPIKLMPLYDAHLPSALYKCRTTCVKNYAVYIRNRNVIHYLLDYGTIGVMATARP